MNQSDLYNNYSTILQSESTIEHIFVGEVKSGKAVGFHHEGDWAKEKNSSIIGDTKTVVDLKGVYEAEVIIKGINKNGFSSFFSEKLMPEDVLEYINEAYLNRKRKTRRGLYQGITKSGLEINFYLDDKNKIKTAFPLYSY